MLAVAGLALGPALFGIEGSALAGGTPENALIIIDPSSAESMYVGNYYKNARNIPDSNVLYIDPEAANYAAFAGTNLEALAGHLRNAQLEDHIDYIVIPPGQSFYVPAPGLVTDGCFPVARFSMSSVWTMAFLKADILGGGASTRTNQYHSLLMTDPRGFDSNVTYINGVPATGTAARRYYIGAMLGYTGERGNTLAEVLNMIDRSVFIDGTRPGGTFYFMSTTDGARNVRAPQFPAVIADITAPAQAGLAQQISGVLPSLKHDCLGVLTGWATPPIKTETMTLLRGSFADHLTSYAATFDEGSQVKMSEWISIGASGTAGTVEEPCNYTGKFPNARLHAYYWRGMSLGESYLRTMAFIPFQSLFIGDPLTRPFTYIPNVSIPNLPTSPVSGQVFVNPQGLTSLPGGVVTGFDVHANGVLVGSGGPGFSIGIQTTKLPDGWNEVRAIGYDGSVTKSAGRFVGSIIVNNAGRSATLGSASTSGGLTTLFQFDAAGLGGAVKELRLLQNGRVIGAGTVASGTFSIWGQNLGGGKSRVQSEAVFTDGKIARSAPLDVNVDYVPGAPSGGAPFAFGYTKFAQKGGPFVVELPASFDNDPSGVTFEIVTPPAQATFVGSINRGYRILSPSPTAGGSDQFTYRVISPSGTSNTATVVIQYPATCIADFNGDGKLDIQDFTAFQNAFAVGDLRADVTGDGKLDIQDFTAFQNKFAIGCP